MPDAPSSGRSPERSATLVSRGEAAKTRGCRPRLDAGCDRRRGRRRVWHGGGRRSGGRRFARARRRRGLRRDSTRRAEASLSAASRLCTGIRRFRARAGTGRPGRDELAPARGADRLLEAALWIRLATAAAAAAARLEAAGSKAVSDRNPAAAARMGKRPSALRRQRTRATARGLRTGTPAGPGHHLPAVRRADRRGLVEARCRGAAVRVCDRGKRREGEGNRTGGLEFPVFVGVPVTVNSPSCCRCSAKASRPHVVLSLFS